MNIDLTSLALLITSIATVTYATLTFFLLMETRKEKKSSIIEEVLGVVLYPLLGFLKEELSGFKRDNARLQFIKGKIKSNSRIKYKFSWGADLQIYENFRKNHPSLAKKIDKHDSCYDKIENEAGLISKVAYTPEFIKKCRDLIYEWDKSQDSIKLSETYNDIDRLSEDLFAYTINFMDSLPERHMFYDFWKENNHIFNKYLEKIAKKETKQLKNSIKEIEDITKKLFVELEKITDIYCKKYGISMKFVTEKYNVYRTGY